MTDFSVPQRMSLGALLIYFLKSFRYALNAGFICSIYEIVKSDGNLVELLQKIGAIICVTVGIALILAFLGFFYKTFYVENGNLIYRHNLIYRTATTIPLSSIHTLRTRQGILYRLLGVRGVLFDTLASKGEELELILNESDWQSLIDRVELQEQPHPAAPDMPPVYNPVSTKKFSDRDLLLDALCQNHLKGMLVLGGFAVIVFNALSDLPKNAIDTIASYLESHMGDFAVSLAGIAMLMGCMYIVSLILWLGKVFLRYHGLSLTYDCKTLTFCHGLLSRQSSRFASDKICTLWVKRNYFERQFGLCTLALKQALNSSAEKMGDNLRIYGRDCSRFFLGWWLGQGYASEADIATAKSGKGVITFSLLPDLLVSSIASAILYNFGLYAWISIPVIYLLICIFKAVLTMRHSYITLKESYIIVGNGRFAEIKNYMKYDNVEVVRIRRTPLSRFTGRISLSLSTSGSSFTIRSLRQDQAMYIYELILAESAYGTCVATE